ncbi:forkhead box protein B2 [Drosophila innubila]|uniref:forkhead box protein B2 n=1 Tax=Drosophila innubila TaxID=198719 RepID=UPI00148C9DB1|nr:forkhead box protein B2 [Drosophila innubila]
METYLTEIKQLRIPRPKFEPNSCHQQHQHATAAAAAGAAGVTATMTPPPPHHHHHHQQYNHHHHAHHQWRHFVRPFTPPRDYHLPIVGAAVSWSTTEDSSTHDKM